MNTYTAEKCKYQMQLCAQLYLRRVLMSGNHAPFGEFYKEQFYRWHSRYLAVTAPALIPRDEKLYCTKCGQAKILCTGYVSASATGPAEEYHCPSGTDEQVEFVPRHGWPEYLTKEDDLRF